MTEKKSTRKAAKTPKAARNISREPLQEHVRGVRGAGRKPVAAIMVPLEVKEQFECFKAVYADRFGAATNEQVLLRWMDGLGTEFDKTLATEARKLYRKRLQEAKKGAAAPAQAVPEADSTEAPAAE